MSEIEKLLQECEKRMESTTELLLANMQGNSDTEITKLLEAAKELDHVKAKALQELTALENCKRNLSHTQEPWDFDVKDMFKHEMEASVNEKSKRKKQGFYDELQKFIRRQQDEDEVMEVEKEATQAIDPWTRQPIQHPMQSTTCKHLYDKKSINCIIKNRNHFKCPYIGCQSVITKEMIIDVSNES